MIQPNTYTVLFAVAIIVPNNFSTKHHKTKVLINVPKRLFIASQVPPTLYYVPLIGIQNYTLLPLARE